MEVILLERIAKLGQMGDVVQVKAGYARNYLLPQGKGLRATEANKKHFEGQRAQLEATNLETRKEADKLGEKLNGLSVIMVRQAGEAGQLYGSVNARDISTAVTDAERRCGISTPWPPNAATERTIAPRFRGSEMLSRATSNGAIASAFAAASRSSGCA